MALSLMGCRTPGPGPIFAALDDVPGPPEARLEAEHTKDPARAAELAWLYANDRAYARERLQAGLRDAPNKAPLRLRRALLNLTELRHDEMVDDLLTLIRDAPKSPEAELALVLLYDQLDALVHRHPDIEAAIERTGWLQNKPARTAGRVTLSCAVMARISHHRGDDPQATEALDRGGFVTQMRGIGPLAPADPISLVADSRYELSGDWSTVQPFRGRPAPVRAVLSQGQPGLQPTGDPGLYVFDAYFEVSPEASKSALMLEAHLPSSARVRIDGTVVVRRSAAERRAGGMDHTPLRLTPGWHRIAVALLANSGTRFALALTTQDGRRVTAQSMSGPLLATPAAPPPSVGSPIVDLQGDTSPWGLVHRLIRDEEHTVFARLLGHRLAESTWYDDPDRAWWMLHQLREALPESAAVPLAWAQLYAGQGQQSLAQTMLQEGLRLDPSHPGALLALARALSSERPEAALDLVDQALKVAPNAWQSAATQADIYRRLGWNAETSQALNRALELGAPAAVVRTAERFFRGIEHHEDADRVEARLDTLSSRDRFARAAQSAERMGHIDKAIVAWRQSAAMQAPADALTRIAELELARLQPGPAARAAQDALQLDPWHAPALKAAVQASLLLGDKPRAQALIRTLRTLGEVSLEQELWVNDLSALGPDAQEGLRFDPWLGVRAAGPGMLPPGKDPADRWAQFDSVALLDRVVDRVLPDGRALSWRHSVTRLQTKDATDRAGEFDLPPEAIILASRTLKSDGRVVEADRHAGKDDLSFSALAPGDAVEREWIHIDRAASAWGGYMRQFYFQGTSPLVRSELVVIVPKGAPVWTHSYHGAPQPKITEGLQESVYVWRADDVAPLRPEAHTPAPEESVPFVVVTVGLPGQAARAAPLLGTLESARGSQQVQHLAHALTATTAAAQDKLTRLFRYVVKNLDDGPPRPPELVLTTQRGERSGVFVALARASGIKADVVWASPGLSPRAVPDYGNPDAFAVRLVRAEPEPGRIVWARLDKGRTWMGDLPPHFAQGRFLRAGPEGPVVDEIPSNEVGPWRASSEVELTVDEEGQATGHITLTVPAGYAGPLRDFLASARPQEAARQLQGLAASLLRGAQLNRHRAEPLHDPLADLTLRLEVKVPFFMARDETHLVAEEFFDAPLTLRTMGLPRLDAYLGAPQRTRPLLVRPVAETMRVQVHLPARTAGIDVGPRPFDRALPLAHVRQAVRYDSNTQTLVLQTEYETQLGRIAPGDFPAFAAAAQDALQALRNRLVVTLGPRAATAGRVNNEPSR